MNESHVAILHANHTHIHCTSDAITSATFQDCTANSKQLQRQDSMTRVQAQCKGFSPTKKECDDLVKTIAVGIKAESVGTCV